MSKIRKKTIERREKLARNMLWQADEKAREHYRQVLMRLAAFEFRNRIPRPEPRQAA